MTALLQLGYCFMLIIGAAGAGSFLWRGRNESPAEHWIHASAVGFAAIHLLILYAGFARCLFPWLPPVLLAALFLAGCRPAFSIARGVWREWRKLPRDYLFSVFTAAAVLSAFFLLVACFRDEIETDAFMYHISAPIVWLRDGRIYPIPYHMHSQLHFLTQMANILIVGLPGYSIALVKLVQWYYAILLSLGAGLLAGRLAGRRAGMAAVCAVIMALEVSQVVRGALMDVGVGLYVFLGIRHLLLNDDGAEDSGMPWRAGLFFGLAWSAKNTGILFFAAAAAAWMAAATCGGRKMIWDRLRLLIQTGAVVFLVALPWIIKNLFFTWNPFYPFLWKILPTRPDYYDMALGFSRYYSGFRGYATPWGVAAHMIDIIPQFISNMMYRGSDVMAAGLLLGGLMLCLRRGEKIQGRAALAAFALFAFIMMYLTPFPRFVIGLYPVAAALFFLGAKRILRDGVLFSALLSLVVLLAGLSFARNNILSDAGRLDLGLPASGAQPITGWRSGLFRRTWKPDVDWAGIIEEKGGEKHSRILICVNRRILIECPARFLPNPHMHAPSLPALHLSRYGEAGLLESLREWGVTHVLVSVNESGEVLSFLEKNAVLQESRQSLNLYHMKRDE